MKLPFACFKKMVLCFQDNYKSETIVEMDNLKPFPSQILKRFLRLMHVYFLDTSPRMLKLNFPSFNISKCSGGEFPQYLQQVSISGACLSASPNTKYVPPSLIADEFYQCASQRAMRAKGRAMRAMAASHAGQEASHASHGCEPCEPCEP